MQDKVQYAKSRVSADIWQRARAAAVAEGISMRAWLERAMEQSLKLKSVSR